MDFSETQLQEAVRQINDGLSDLSRKIAEVPVAARAATDHWYIPGPVADVINWLAQEITDLAGSVLNKIREVMVGVAAPVLFFQYAFDWQDIRGIANGVTGELKPDVLVADGRWTGPAAATYAKIIAPQGNAANKLATISDKTATALGICAGVGLTFYLAIAVILAKFIVAMGAALAAFGTAVLSWAGAALVVEEAGVNSGLIWGAIGALTAALGTQAQQMISLHGEAVDDSTFPGGHWPDPVASSFRNGSVQDGHAGWSLDR